MSYHPLTQESGGNEYDRRLEANRILDILEAELDLDATSPNERRFLEKMIGDRNQKISTRQLFWLRDLKDRAL